MDWREWALYRIRRDPRVLGRLYSQEFLFEHQEMQGSKITLQWQRARFPSNLSEYTTRLPMVKWRLHKERTVGRRFEGACYRIPEDCVWRYHGEVDQIWHRISKKISRDEQGCLNEIRLLLRLL